MKPNRPGKCLLLLTTTQVYLKSKHHNTINKYILQDTIKQFKEYNKRKSKKMHSLCKLTLQNTATASKYMKTA